MEELCYGDVDWPLQVSIWDFEENGQHRWIGNVETKLSDLTKKVAIRGNADRVTALEIYKESKSTNKLKTRGLLVVLKADVQMDPNDADDGLQAQVSL